MLRIVAISDTHGYHKNLVIPDGDVLIHAGDWSHGRGSVRDTADLNAWLGTLPHAYKLITAGNHDMHVQSCPEIAKAMFTNAKLLIDESAVVDGRLFYFSPWTPTFYNWGYMADRGARIRAKWARIPVNTDILVTHGPPHGIRDQCPQSVGCEELRESVFEIRPKLHIFGHIHEGAGVSHVAGITFANASICTGAYAPVNPPLVFDI